MMLGVFCKDLFIFNKLSYCGKKLIVCHCSINAQKVIVIFALSFDFMILKVQHCMDLWVQIVACPPARPSCCCEACSNIDGLSSEARMQALSVTLCLELISCFVPEALPLNHPLQSHCASPESQRGYGGE